MIISFDSIKSNFLKWNVQVFFRGDGRWDMGVGRWELGVVSYQCSVAVGSEKGKREKGKVFSGEFGDESGELGDGSGELGVKKN